MRSLAIPTALSLDTTGGGRVKVKPAPGSIPRASAGYANPPFDGRIFQVRMADGGGLARGRLKAYDSPYALEFLYNPSVIDVSHTLDATVMADSAKSPNALGVDVGAVGGAVTWSLLFDRTYETWDSKYKGTLQGDSGVYSDVRALYRLLGIVSSDVPDRYSEVPDGFMQMVPVIVTFGGMSSNSLSYYGFINSLNISYTHWTRNMVPNRCVLNLGMNIYPLTGAAAEATVGTPNYVAPNATKPNGIDSARPDATTRGKNAQ